MKYLSKMLFISLIFSVILPTAQSSNIFKDISNMNENIMEMNDTLAEIKTGINNLESTMNDMNESLSQIEQGIDLLEKTNEGIEKMSEELDEITNKSSEALNLVDKFDGYIGDLKIILAIGIASIILAILTVIGATIVIVKRKKN